MSLVLLKVDWEDFTNRLTRKTGNLAIRRIAGPVDPRTFAREDQNENETFQSTGIGNGDGDVDWLQSQAADVFYGQATSRPGTSTGIG